MNFRKLYIQDFRQFSDQEVFIGNKLTALAGNNGTGKSIILGILANSSQLLEHHTYFGKSYKGEFSELFSGTQTKDPSGKKIKLEYVERGDEKELWFRTGWQNKKTRFRIIPKRVFDDGTFTEAKLESPVIYLGLSRLYTVGEADRKKLKMSKQKWPNDEDRKWFEEKYKYILSLRSDVKSVSQFGITGLSRKAGTGIETDSYGPSANSSGQDNVGQILMSILSFRKLKEDLGDDWDGGLLLIDELDATLHPAAQIRLVDLLLKESGNLGIQIAFTTHSTVILEKLSSINGHNPAERPGDVEVDYLTDANKKLKVLRNPTWPQMENDLLVKSSGFGDTKGLFASKCG